MTSEGYVVIALDDPRYLELAANFALSVRRIDTRPVSVIVNRAVPERPDYRTLFDQVVVAEDDPDVRGAMNKIRLNRLTPYDRTMYVDADCLLINARVELFWRKYRDCGFAVEGHRQSRGPVFACSLGAKDAAELCKLLGVAELTVFNAGVIYFERGTKGDAVFAKARELYNGPLREKLTYRYKHAGEYADEPIFGAAMALLGLPPFEPPLTNRLQVTTPNLVEGVIDLDTGDLQLLKQPAGGPAQVWSGAICHFCGLAPMDTYFDLADRLRRAAKLPSMNRGLFRPVLLTATHHHETV
ncbi:MAG: hypothetical protein SFV21_12255 [Rhodospirillaceae bacterium]|nr:hypothetical protein [Rhodospirillaceae bacterium]